MCKILHLFKDIPVLNTRSCGRAEIAGSETESAAWKLVSINITILLAQWETCLDGGCDVYRSIWEVVPLCSTLASVAFENESEFEVALWSDSKRVGEWRATRGSESTQRHSGWILFTFYFALKDSTMTVGGAGGRGLKKSVLHKPLQLIQSGWKW